MKINNQSSKSDQKNPLNLKRTRNSKALKQSQSFDFSYSSITGFKRVAICTALALGIIPLSASADRVVIDGEHDITIDGASYTSNDDDCLTISNSNNIIIKNANFINCYGVGVAISDSTNIRILTSYFEDVNAGVYARDSKTIKVSYNKFKNVSRIDHADESRGQFVQFNRVTGAGNLIQSNIGINEPGFSDPEEAVNLYKSSGTEASPIRISKNCFKGGSSEAGGGIMTGDSGGANQVIENNTLVDVGQQGIAVASGTNIKVLNNRIYGQESSISNVGLYVWNQYDSACSNITVQGNIIDFTNKNGRKNPFYDGQNCGIITGEGDNSDNDFDSDLSALDCSL